MTADQNHAAPGPEASADLASNLLQQLGGSIPAERLPSALQRLEELLGFLDQVETLDIDMTAPAAVFDPSWDVL